MSRSVRLLALLQSLRRQRAPVTAASLTLSAEHVRRLDDTSAVPAGYPHELLAAHRRMPASPVVTVR